MKYLVFLLLLLCLSCSSPREQGESIAARFGNILDISYTPNADTRCRGWFSDGGSWYGFTLPENGKWVNGFCGPFHLDMNQRKWISTSIVNACFTEEDKQTTYIPDTTIYYPGKLYMKASSAKGSIEQELIFINESTAILSIKSDPSALFRLWGDIQSDSMTCRVEKNSFLITSPSDEGIAVTFPPGAGILINETGYETLSPQKNNIDIVISFFTDKESQAVANQKATSILVEAESYKKHVAVRWEKYLSATLRSDMPEEFNRVAVKAVMTLVSNWKATRGDLYHDGVLMLYREYGQ